MSEFNHTPDDALNPYRSNQGFPQGQQPPGLGPQGNPSLLTSLAICLIVFAVINLMVTVSTPFAGPLIEEQMKDRFYYSLLINEINENSLNDIKERMRKLGML